MTPRHGDMWSQYTDDPKTLFLVPCNSTLNGRGHLVMGAGAALQAVRRFPLLANEIGTQIYKTCKSLGMYGVIISKYDNVGAFQTKRHWRNESDEYIIRFSVNMLLAHVHSYDTIHMPYPGIGHGGLAREQVEPLIIGLPDMVHVWTYK